MDFKEFPVPGVKSSKRLSIVRIEWLGDWFASHSPRNGNELGEGSWAHWVQLSLSILQHPATAKLYPDVHAAVESLVNTNFYSDGPTFTDEEVEQLFGVEGDR